MLDLRFRLGKGVDLEVEIESGFIASLWRFGGVGERSYQYLNERGYFPGDPLQAAAIFLHLTGLPTASGVERFERLDLGFREAGISIFQGDYDELALLASLGASAADIIALTLKFRDEIRALPRPPNRGLAFNLACSLAFQELAHASEAVEGLADAKALLDLQSLLAAQQAATIAATTAAVTAS